jgi:ABC-type transport system involved in multi-copper enzyme maturation permease subunit
LRSLNSFLLLLSKELRELKVSRAYWLLVLAIGPLVGHAFINAVNLYAEASGIGGGPAALPQGLTPLDGMLAPTFGAYDLAVTLLFPFVAIRMIAAEKESGALKLSLQLPFGTAKMVAAKFLALVAGWFIAWLPGLIAVAMWRAYGGHLFAPETLNLMLGHWLRMLLGAGIAIAAAALAESAASAAIVTLCFTLGTWALDFIAAGRGGWLAALAAYTPAAALRFFEHGLLRLNVVVVILALALAGLGIAAIWLHSGRNFVTRLLRTTVLLGIIIPLGVSLGSFLRASWDASENRRNSFSRTDEAALRQIREPLRITIYLAAEDPRLMDYERGILNKLRRILPRLKVDYAAQSRTGLFEEDSYGKIWYELGANKVMNRSTTGPIVIEQLYQLAGITAPANTDEPVYPGYPLAAHPRGASLIFYALWPLTVIAVWCLTTVSSRQ